MKTPYHSISRLLLGLTFLASLAFVVYANTDKSSKESSEDISISVKKDEGPASENLPVYTPGSYWIGVQVVPVPDILLPHFGVKEDGAGLVVVQRVVEEGPAAKAGLKRGDVILQFGGKAVHSLPDLVQWIGEAKETEQPMVVVREGNQTNLTVTPEPRPNEPIALSGHPAMQGAPRRMPMLPQHGMRLGPEVWIGPRDPQQMMREMEEYFRQMQGGIDADQLLLLPEDGTSGAAPSEEGSARQLAVSSHTDADGKTTIKVTQILKSGDKTEEKTWEADSVDKLPDEIRGEVEKFFGK